MANSQLVLNGTTFTVSARLLVVSWSLMKRTPAWLERLLSFAREFPFLRFNRSAPLSMANQSPSASRINPISLIFATSLGIRAFPMSSPRSLRLVGASPVLRAIRDRLIFFK
jgi:hypothetical protein